LKPIRCLGCKSGIVQKLDFFSVYTKIATLIAKFAPDSAIYTIVTRIGYLLKNKPFIIYHSYNYD